MNIKLLLFVIITAAIGSLQAGTEVIPAATQFFAPATRGFTIVSPDHPATWEVGFNDKVGQDLKWSEREGKLVLDVTYSRITYTDTIPPSDFKTYRVTFPRVSLDAYGQLYVLDKHGQKIIIGSRASGPFGRQVALNKGVLLSAHRRNGRINAMLVVRNAR